MQVNNIKWGCIQPLTGGMYIGAEYAIGHKADWVLSYPGLTSIKYDKTGNMTDVGNEYNLLKWCERNNDLPAYKVFDRKPFDDISEVNVNLIDDPVWTKNSEINVSETDVVVSVPVCSGLSQATIAKGDTKDRRNNNMIFNATYTLEIVKPKIYIFENAPTLFSSTGNSIRNIINALGEKYGYSVAYYKTNTKFHDNCQNRPRTFVFMIKHRGKYTGCPSLNYEHISPTVKEYLSRIPSDATQQDSIDLSPVNSLIMKFIKYKYGDDFRNIGTTWSIDCIINNSEEFYRWLETVDDDLETVQKLKKLIDHILYKLSLNKNFYAIAPMWLTEESDISPVCMFKTIPTTIHYKENRVLSTREWLHLMGHPADFELYGDYKANYSKLGQNVPVRTAQFIVSEAVRIINEWDTIPRNNPEIYMFDNTKVKKINTKKLF